MTPPVESQKSNEAAERVESKTWRDKNAHKNANNLQNLVDKPERKTIAVGEKDEQGNVLIYQDINEVRKKLLQFWATTITTETGESSSMGLTLNHKWKNGWYAAISIGPTQIRYQHNESWTVEEARTKLWITWTIQPGLKTNEQKESRKKKE